MIQTELALWVDTNALKEELLMLRRKLSHRDSTLLQKLELWQQIIQVQSQMSYADIKEISQLVASEVD